MKNIGKIVGLIVVVLTFFSIVGVIDIPSFVQTSSAQYNVAPPVCVNMTRVPVWDGTNWICSDLSLAVAVTPVTSTQTAKQTLLTQTLPANYLFADAGCVRVTAWGTTLNNNNNKTQTIDFGATTVASTGAVANNNGAWVLRAIVCRTSATTQASIGEAQSAATTAALTNAAPGETTSGTIVINVTSTNQTSVNGTTARGIVVERVN